MLSRRSLLLSSPALLLGVASATRAETVQAGPSDLAKTLESARPGTVIALEGGDYGSLSLRGGGGSAQAPVVLRSADPGRPARFARMGLTDVGNLVLEGLVFAYVAARGDDPKLRPFRLRSCHAITLRGCVFVGDRVVHGGIKVPTPTAYGLSFHDLRDVTLEGSRITTFLRGLIVSNSRGVTIQGNQFDGLRSDGMDFAQVEDVRIEGNLLRDFDRPPGTGDHPDMIQFWTNGTSEPSRNITIRDNVLNVGTGPYTQSIFMRNEMVDARGAGREMFYRNILIEENVIVNAHAHGITVGETDGLVIRNNSVLRNPHASGEGGKPSLWTPRIRVARTSANVQVLRNVTAAIDGHDGQRDWVVADNLLVQDRGRMEPGFYGVVFGMAALSAPEHIESFAPRRGGPLDGANLGAARLRALPPQP